MLKTVFRHKSTILFLCSKRKLGLSSVGREILFDKGVLEVGLQI